MYLPEHFQEDRPDVLHQLIRAYPFGLLVSTGPSGFLANGVPFLFDPDRGTKGTLRAHVARANPHWEALRDAPSCLVIFQGPQAYITPSWYKTKQVTGKVVPTWNYVMVQVRGVARIFEDATWLRGQVDELTDTHEAAHETPWHTSDAPEPFVTAQLRGIVGIEIPVTAIEGKWKMSQNRNEDDRNGVAAGLSLAGPQGQAVGRLVELEPRSHDTSPDLSHQFRR